MINKNNLNNEETVHKVLASLKVKNANEHIKKQELSSADKVAAKLTIFSGSWTFVLLLGGFIFGWILFNTFVIKLDVFPFILLNLIISIVCVLQSPVIMMGQSLDLKRSETRDECSFETNQKNQLFLEHLHQKIDAQDAILEKQDQVLAEQSKQIQELIELVKDLKNNK